MTNEEKHLEVVYRDGDPEWCSGCNPPDGKATPNQIKVVDEVVSRLKDHLMYPCIERVLVWQQICHGKGAGDLMTLPANICLVLKDGKGSVNPISALTRSGGSLPHWTVEGYINVDNVAYGIITALELAYYEKVYLDAHPEEHAYMLDAHKERFGWC